jgi:hypothetical protein
MFPQTRKCHCKWVQHQTTAKSYDPTRVSIDGCEYVHCKWVQHQTTAKSYGLTRVAIDGCEYVHCKWVQHQTTAKFYGLTRVAIQECTDVDDFKVATRNNPQRAIPKDSAITLYQLKNGQDVEILSWRLNLFIAGNSKSIIIQTF